MGGTPGDPRGSPLRVRRPYYSRAAAAQTRAVEAPAGDAADANPAARSNAVTARLQPRHHQERPRCRCRRQCYCRVPLSHCLRQPSGTSSPRLCDWCNNTFFGRWITCFRQLLSPFLEEEIVAQVSKLTLLTSSIIMPLSKAKYRRISAWNAKPFALLKFLPSCCGLE